MNRDPHVPWTAGLELACLSCDAVYPPDRLWFGCAVCGAPLRTRYPANSDRCLPVARADTTDLGLAPTPLVEHCQNSYLKLEYRNPTGSHKDRFHSITSAVARLAGARGIVTTSTGNHGISCAAHAAHDRLPCVVLATTGLTPSARTELLTFGAIVGELDEGGRRQTLQELLTAGWFPSTSSDHALSGAANPYGCDGYREIAAEIVSQLGRNPDAVLVPAASGDTLLGIGLGFEALTSMSGAQMPILLACQPTGAATFARSLAEGRQAVLPTAASVAKSISDRCAGRLALEIVRRHGDTIQVDDHLILSATRDLARRGHYVEPSAAIGVAALSQARQRKVLGSTALAVAVVTAGGRGWNEYAPGLAGGNSPETSVSALLERAEASAAFLVTRPK